ncbi:hypothetical protein C8F01DRAFT_319934 [Mycena amicta]|nr:hypothetical protein C8F01DRAFT_319934 [Mycena amicta]
MASAFHLQSADRIPPESQCADRSWAWEPALATVSFAPHPMRDPTHAHRFPSDGDTHSLAIPFSSPLLDMGSGEQLNFIIVGASVTGLASGIALKKSGHSVVILEKASQLGEGRSTVPVGCARIPPNGSKILYDWGLNSQIEEYATIGTGFAVYRYEGAGEDLDLMGFQSYDQEMLTEARGHYLTIRHIELVRILYHEFISSASSPHKNKHTVRFDANVTSVNCDACTVTLHTGEVLLADAIIGADGIKGVVRSALRREEEAERSSRASVLLMSPGEEGHGYDFEMDFMEPKEQVQGGALSVYSALIPKSAVPELDSSLRGHSQAAFFGSNRAALVFDVGEDLSFCVISPDDEYDDDTTPPKKALPKARKMTDVLGPVCDAGIRKLAALADAGVGSTTVCVKIHLQDPRALQSWVSESGRVVVLGEAAHPLPPTSVHTYSSALEDSAFIGKIFSHTHDRARVPEFLYAFQEHREPRCTLIHSIELKYIWAMTLQNGEMQAMRDAMFRANHAKGRNVLDMHGIGMESVEAQAMEETLVMCVFVCGFPRVDAGEWANAVR